MKSKFGARRIVFFIVMGIIAVFVFGAVVMLLWNNVLAPVVHISSITFWQALGILVLSKILFGGFSGGPGFRRYRWRQRMMQKWNSMTPEEKERFRSQLKGRCGDWSEKPWQSETGGEQPKPESV